MTILYLYKEDDLNCSNELSCLRDGYHYIGREAPVNFSDKRISRKHARIVVHRNGATIQSVHINPTFYKSPSSAIQLLRENDLFVLNNGDCFALLEDSTWFKVKIICENTEGTFAYDSLSRKRANEEETIQLSKRIKIEPESSQPDSSNAILNNQTSENLLDSTVELPVDNLIESSVVSTSSLNTNLEHNSLLGQIIKTEPVDTDQPSSSTSYNTIKVKIEKPDLDLPMPLPLVEIKTEPVNDGFLNNQVIKTELNQPSSSTNDNIPSWKKDHPDWRRDKCWYGKSCYRKNPTHKEDFSHPGDNDHDSDPNDNRSYCPYGRCCYRRNIEHRREFKHFGKPGPRNNVNININVNRCTCCNQPNHTCCNQSNRKPDYESDCEDTDPE